MWSQQCILQANTEILGERVTFRTNITILRTYPVINRPCVAGAVLQTPSLLIE